MIDLPLDGGPLLLRMGESSLESKKVDSGLEFLLKLPKAATPFWAQNETHPLVRGERDGQS